MTFDQDAADAAYAWLAFAKGRRAGLVTGGPVVDGKRARWILKQCARRGVRPRRDAIVRLIQELIALSTSRDVDVDRLVGELE